MNHTSGNIDELLIRILDDTATRADVRMFADMAHDDRCSV